MLLIWRIFEDHELEPDPGESVFWNNIELRIYKVEAAGSELKEINCLNDHVLFLGHNHFVSVLKSTRLSGQIMRTLLMIMCFGHWDLRILTVIWEFSTWMIAARKNLYLLSFVPSFRLLFGLDLTLEI